MSVQLRERRRTVPVVAAVALGVVALIAVLVSVSSRSNGTPVAATRLLKVSSEDFRYRGFPSTIHSGLFQVAFSNDEGFPFRHEMVIVQLQPGQSAQTVVADAKANGADSEDNYLHFGEILGRGHGSHARRLVRPAAGAVRPGVLADGAARWRGGPRARSPGDGRPVHRAVSDALKRGAKRPDERREQSVRDCRA